MPHACLTSAKLVLRKAEADAGCHKSGSRYDAE